MHLTGFFGRYTTTIDEKGRCILPAKLRAVTDDAEKPILAGEIFLTKGLEGCLAVYPQKEWDAIQQRMSTLEFTDRSYRSFSRRFYSFAAPVVADKNGRILIPAHLIAEADLDKELVVLGVNRWIEIWNPQLLKYYMEKFAGSYEEVAARLFTGDGGSRRGRSASTGNGERDHC
jgi:MraZ protein